MYLFWLTSGLAVTCFSALANLELRPAGWLDRLVQYQKDKFIEDVNEEAPVKIKASIQSRPIGYVDSPAWDFTSVSHLLTLIEESPDAGEVRGALRRMLQPSRRFMSRPQSFKHFPSLSKNSINYFYYQIDTNEMYYDEDNSTNTAGRLDEDSVLMISNPVEARLPSAQISVRLLKEILEARAVAAKVMPNITRVTMKWITRPTTPTAPGNDSETGSETPASDGGSAVNDTIATADGEETTADA